MRLTTISQISRDGNTASITRADNRETLFLAFYLNLQVFIPKANFSEDSLPIILFIHLSLTGRSSPHFVDNLTKEKDISEVKNSLRINSSTTPMDGERREKYNAGSQNQAMQRSDDTQGSCNSWLEGHFKSNEADQ